MFAWLQILVARILQWPRILQPIVAYSCIGCYLCESEPRIWASEMASRGRASRTEAPPPTEAARKIVEKNHNLRPFALESLPKHANSRDVLYRTLRVLRCFILLPCTCPSSRCHGCEPGYKAPLVAA